MTKDDDFSFYKYLRLLIIAINAAPALCKFRPGKIWLIRTLNSYEINLLAPSISGDLIDSNAK